MSGAMAVRYTARWLTIAAAAAAMASDAMGQKPYEFVWLPTQWGKKQYEFVWLPTQWGKTHMNSYGF